MFAEAVAAGVLNILLAVIVFGVFSANFVPNQTYFFTGTQLLFFSSRKINLTLGRLGRFSHRFF
jgi:hypothetical protein